MLLWLINSGLIGSARAEDAQGTPTQSHISPSLLVYEGKHKDVVTICTGKMISKEGGPF